MKSRGRDAAHTSGEVEERVVNLVVADYCYFGKCVSKKETERLIEGPGTILVMCETDSGAMMSCQVRTKGRKDVFAQAAVQGFINTLGTKKITLQTDGENSLKDLMHAAREKSKIEIIYRNSSVGDHQLNGAAETAVEECECQVRAMTRQIESRYNISLPPSSWIFPWIVRHASWTLIRFATHGPLKRTSYFVTRGVEYRGILAELGECVMIRTKSLTKTKLDSRWVSGVFVGKGELTDEWLVAAFTGIVKARTGRRLPIDTAWDKDEFLSVIGIPSRRLIHEFLHRNQNTLHLRTSSLHLYANEPIDVEDADNDLNLDRPQAQGQESSSSAGAAAPSSPSRDAAMGSDTPQARSPVTPPASPKRSRATEPAGSPKRSAAEAELTEDTIGGLLDMPLDTPHELDDPWQWIKDELNEGMDEEIAKLYALGDEKELQQLRDFDVYEEVPRTAATGHKVISTRWVRKLKTPTEACCRLVAREFNTGKRDDTFATTPSSTSSRVVDLLATKLQLCTATADVSVAFLHATEEGLVFVEPAEGYHSDAYDDGDFLW
jgi:hypothetical protein